MARHHSTRATPGDIRQAHDYLQTKGLGGKLTPALLARSSHEMGKPFADVLKLVGTMLDAGQGAGPAPIAKEIALEHPNA